MEEPPTILLVEDLESDALLIEQAFRKAHVRNPIRRLMQGREAIAYLGGTGQYENRKEFPLPIFVLLDLKLPDIHGYEVLRWIRRAGPLDQLPVVVVTGSENAAEEQQATDLGANAFFRKQLNFENLVQLVQSVGGYWSLRTSG